MGNGQWVMGNGIGSRIISDIAIRTADDCDYDFGDFGDGQTPREQCKCQCTHAANKKKAKIKEIARKVEEKSSELVA